MILNCSEQAQLSLQERMDLESKIDEAFGEDFKPKSDLQNLQSADRQARG